MQNIIKTGKTLFLPILPAIAGFLLISLTTISILYQTLWDTSQNAHGPIVLLVAIYFIFYRFRQIDNLELDRYSAQKLPTILLVAIGSLFYLVGHSQIFFTLEVLGLILIAAGLFVFYFGWFAFTKVWFGFFFLLFLIPLPGSIIDAITLPLKIAVSWATVEVLDLFDYPIARNGVIIYMGQYQLLVADACSGLNSLFSLEALGLLYMNMVRHSSVLRNTVLALLIVPISFTSNVTRVILLSLITYYFGDAAGQGFVHEFSGILLFSVALFLIISLDSLLGLISKKFRATKND